MAAALALFAFWPRPVEETNIVLNEESAYGKVLDFGSRRYQLVTAPRLRLRVTQENLERLQALS